MSRALTRLGLRSEKTLIATKRCDAAGTAWLVEMADIDAGTVVILDETSTQIVMKGRRERAPRG